jgi:hypothetical protein
MPKSNFSHLFQKQLIARWIIPMLVMALLAILIQVVPYFLAASQPALSDFSVTPYRAPLGSPNE